MDRAKLEFEGWKPMEVGGFSGAVGPFWIRGCGVAIQVGLVAEDRHCNSNVNTVHGGVLLTFADFFLGRGVVEVLGGTNLVTAQLQLQFVSAARSGDLIVGTPELIRRTSQLVFMRGLIAVADRTVVSADGIWKITAAQAPS